MKLVTKWKKKRIWKTQRGTQSHISNLQEGFVQWGICETRNFEIRNTTWDAHKKAKKQSKSI